MEKDEFVKKADLALSDLTKNGGELSEAESRKFAYMLMAGQEYEMQEKIKHHLDRAKMHRQNRDYAYAVGSDKKALKWVKRLASFLEGRAVPDPNPLRTSIIDIMADRMAADMEDALINGDPGHRHLTEGIFGTARGINFDEPKKPAKIGFGHRILRKAIETKGRKQ